MTRGCRVGKLTKGQLLERLIAHSPPGILPSEDAPFEVIYGHAVYYKLLEPLEIVETCPRFEKTIPCYLRPRLVSMPKGFEDAIRKYVVVASELYIRGTRIANQLAINTWGARTTYEPGQYPRFNLHDSIETLGSLRDFLLTEKKIQNGPFKQVFLPERWPTSQAPQSPLIASVLEANGHTLPPLPPAWTEVLTVSGWDNSINRMATKYLGNIKVHACSGMAERLKDYLKVVSLKEGTPRESIFMASTGPLRPLIMHQDDFEMALDIRKVLQLEENSLYPPKNTSWSQESLALHVFLVRHGPQERSYLPVADRSLKFSYLDAKIAGNLLSMMAGSTKRKKKNQKASSDESSEQETKATGEPEPSVCIGDLLGLTPQNFKAQNKALRREMRRRLRKLRSQTPSEKRERRERLHARCRAMSVDPMHPDARVDSVETDTVGLRLHVKIPKDVERFKRPLPETAEAPTPKRPRTTRKSRGTSASKESEEEADSFLFDQPMFPVMVGVDEGRSKLFTAAISTNPLKKPESLAFTRKHYYSAMGYWRHQKWSQGRSRKPEVQSLLTNLANAGGLKTCRPDRWEATLRVEQEHRGLLKEEYLENNEYAMWRMRLFRKKRQALDRGVQKIIRAASQGQPRERAIVIGLGDAKFPSTGRGEMAVPTTQLGVAIQRAVARARETNRLVEIRNIWEFRTTKCCCGCGMVTESPMVEDRKRGGQRRSRRLRLCTSCEETTGKRRDRDVQAARNILWLLQHKMHGSPRPWYLDRGS